jgi:hypothetical protein
LSCVKHFAGYGAVEGGREYNTVDFSRVQLWNKYLPSYKAAVDAGAATVMNAFNVYDGIPASGNKYLINDILKKRWGFKGFLVSDWGSFKEMILHGYASDDKDAALKAFKAGSMMDMESKVTVKYLPMLVKEGKITMQEVDEVVGKVKGKVIIKEYPPKRASFDVIEAHLQQLEHQNDFKPDLIIIDYLDYMRTRSRKERKEEIDDVYVAAKAFAKEKGIPVVSPSQANRGAAKSDIIEGDNAAGSYEKIMIGDIILSLARKRKDKIEGTGNWHIMKNRYGADGMTFRSRINTSNGYIDIDQNSVDDDDIETGSQNKAVNDFSNVGAEERQLLQQKFFKLEN